MRQPRTWGWTGPAVVGCGPGVRARRRVALPLVLLVAVLAVALTSDPASAQADRTLRIYPPPPTLAPGEGIELRAWFCRVPASGNVFGDDLRPGTDDDRCEVAAGVRWSTEDPDIARVRPRRGRRVTLTGRADGLTTLRAEYKPSSTSTFAHQVPVDVAEPLSAGPAEPADDPDAADPDAAARPGPGVAVAIIVQPGFAALAPGDQQLFAAYRCPLLGVGDPRGADLSPGTADDFCRPANDAAWIAPGDAPVGELDPAAGPYTVLHTEDDEEETAFVAAGFERPRGPRTAGTEESAPRTGAVIARVGDQEGGASVSIDPAAEPHEPVRPGDVDRDGDVDIDDMERLFVAYGSYAGESDYDGAADFDGNGAVDVTDVGVLITNLVL